MDCTSASSMNSNLESCSGIAFDAISDRNLPYSDAFPTTSKYTPQGSPNSF